MGKVYDLKGDKRRGGARDDSDVYINYNRQELFAMLQQIECRCRRYVENDEKTARKRLKLRSPASSSQGGKRHENGYKYPKTGNTYKCAQ